MPDAEYPFILTTGRQLEHWHTGAMTRRASVLDALEPAADRQLSRGTIAKLGIEPGDMVRVSTRRGVVELSARQDDAVPDGVVFIPFAYVEAAANLLTNPALDPFGKIPEFKYCAAKVEATLDPGEPHRGGSSGNALLSSFAEIRLHCPVELDGQRVASDPSPADTRIQPSLTQYSSTLVFSAPLKRMPMSCLSTSAL